MLGTIEKGLLMILTVPNLRSRLEIFDFKLNFNNSVTELLQVTIVTIFRGLNNVLQSLSTLQHVCQQIIHSNHLKKILEIVLAIGNFCNYNPHKNAVLGFSIEFLTKVTNQQLNDWHHIQLENTRSVDNKTTMIHYLATVLQQKYPNVLQVHDDLSFIEIATKSEYFTMNCIELYWVSL